MGKETMCEIVTSIVYDKCSILAMDCNTSRNENCLEITISKVKCVVM